eukprot:TRINITY_DN61889_c0_g1_i1.p1 TRINITY_DN61889_c0_g1~~TRINITY_DN61889_c0_g1_i1.p1  ORF type:complete len:469 (-),score=75.00 TRINITY_DN61889_c0_g1_i1:12-1334(-)
MEMESGHRKIALGGTEPEDTPEEARIKLAGSKLIGGLRLLNRTVVEIENTSVYGSVILMPQIARSLNWPSEMAQIVVMNFFYYISCCSVHGILLMFIDKEEQVLDAFSGQMYLCDFGAHMGDCPPHGCTGPGGTEMTPPRLYSWGQWTLRNFIRDSFKAVLPDTHNLDTLVDPGEYGVESYWCRLLCCAVFTLSIIPEGILCWRMAELLWFVPNRGESWVDLNPDPEVDQKGPRKKYLDMVQIKIAGMPVHWKLVNTLFVLLPKCSLLFFTAIAGVNFLMETAGIDDIIVNSVALGFLLGLDELVTSILISAQARALMEKCEAFPLEHAGEEDEVLEDGEIVEKFYTRENLQTRDGLMSLFLGIFLKKGLRLYGLVGATILLVYNYYHEHCDYVDGRWISKSMYLPKSMDYGILNAFFRNFFELETEEEPYWTYSGWTPS